MLCNLNSSRRKFRPERDSNPDLCDADSNEISSLGSHISSIQGLMIDPHNDQLPVGLIAQLVEHCTCIVEFCSRLNFSGLSFASAQVA